MSPKQLRNFQFSLNREKIQTKAEEARERNARSGGQGDLEFLNLKNGTNVVRLLPGWWGEDDPRVGDLPFLKVVSWGMIPPDKKSFTAYADTFPDHPMVQKGWVDPIEEAIERLVEEGVVKDRYSMEGKPYKKVTYYCNAFDRDERVVGILGLPSKVYNQIVPIIERWLLGDPEKDPPVPPANVFHPYEGYDLEIEKTRGKRKIDVDYRAAFARLPSKIVNSERGLDKVCEDIKNLDEIFKWPSDEKIAEMEKQAKRMYRWWKERALDLDDDDDRSSRSSRRSRYDDDDDDDRSSSSSRRSRYDDDEDDDRSSRASGRSRREDDEDDRPARSSKRTSRDDDDDREPRTSRSSSRSQDDAFEVRAEVVDDDDDPPRRSHRKDDDPPRRSRRDDDDPPRRSRRDDDDDDPPPRRRQAKSKESDLADGRRPCFGNYEFGHTFCFSCSQDQRCRREFEEKGPNSKAMTPSEAEELEDVA